MAIVNKSKDIIAEVGNSGTVGVGVTSVEIDGVGEGELTRITTSLVPV